MSPEPMNPDAERPPVSPPGAVLPAWIHVRARFQDTRPLWARQTMRPECPACGNYILPCTATATGIHPDPWSERTYVHPHDYNVLVIDTLDQDGNFVRTRNEWRGSYGRI